MKLYEPFVIYCASVLILLKAQSFTMLTKDDLLRALNEQGVTYSLIEHAPAETVEAQSQALINAAPGCIIKNLFLKVKLCSCVAAIN